MFPSNKTYNDSYVGRDIITSITASLKSKLEVYKQTKSVNNRKTENRNDPDLVQAFLKKWWVESDFKAPNPPPLNYGSKFPAVTITVFTTILEQNR
jgi:hypothetical protein